MKCETYTEHGVEYIDWDGQRKALGLNPDTFTLPLKSFSQTMDLPDKSELIKIVEDPGFSFGREHFDSSWTKDQNGWGKCASSAATYAEEKARYLGGQKRIELSDDFLYSLVNGGSDRGSTLAENMRAISTRGIARRAIVGHGDIYRRKYNTAKADKDALRFRAHEAFFINSEQECITALVNQIPVVIAIHVGRNWNRFDKDGVLIGDRGMGNHSEHLDDVRYSRERGRFEFRKHSSHGKRYGDGGFCWVTWQHVDSVHSSHKKYAVPAAIQDPLGENPFSEGWQEDDDTPVADATLTVTSSEFCHWCKKWSAEDRQQVIDGGIEVIPGDVPGSGVPRFRLTVGGQGKDKIGYWPAQDILRAAADLRVAQLMR